MEQLDIMFPEGIIKTNYLPNNLEFIKTGDVVNHPAHYTFGKYEVIDILEDWFPNDPLLWQVGKYIARSPHKHGVQDLEKAMVYLQRRIDQYKNADKERDK